MIKNNLKSEIYNLMDSFLVEAKDQHGNDRSIERLNSDRHLFVENLMEILKREFELLAVIDKEKANNYIKEFLI